MQSETPKLPVAAVQTAALPSCGVCGGPIRGARTLTCSDKCRAIRWRQRREQDREARDREVRELLHAALRRLGGEQP